MLIPMTGVIVSRLSSNSFESFGGLKCVNIFDAKLSCYKKVRNIQIVAFVLPKTMPHFVSVFNLPARRSFFYTAAGGLLAAAKARCTLLHVAII